MSGGRGATARPREAEWSSGVVRFFRRFSFCGVFHFEFGVGAAISLSFESSLILTEVLEIHFSTFFFDFLEKNMLILV